MIELLKSARASPVKISIFHRLTGERGESTTNITPDTAVDRHEKQIIHRRRRALRRSPCLGSSPRLRNTRRQLGRVLRLA